MELLQIQTVVTGVTAEAAELIAVAQQLAELGLILTAVVTEEI
jgi:hypothetical protein